MSLSTPRVQATAAHYVCVKRGFFGSRIFLQTGIFRRFSLNIINLADMNYIESEFFTWDEERSRNMLVNEPKKIGARSAAKLYINFTV